MVSAPIYPQVVAAHGVSVYPSGALQATDVQQALERLMRTFSIKDFGAFGDGIRDDTSAIQAALTAASGSALFIPAGTHLISNTLEVPSNITVFGVGAASIIKLKDASHASLSATSLIRAVSENNLTFTNFTIDGNKANNTTGNTNKGDGLLVQGCDNVSITDLYVHDCPRNGVYAGDNAAIPSTNVVMHGLIVKDTGISAIDGGQGIALVGTDGVTITDCHTTGSIRNGIDLEPNPGDTNLDVTITGCVSTGNTRRGIQLDNDSEAVIVGCVCNNNTLEGIILSNDTGYRAVVVGCALTDNTLDGIRIESDDAVVEGCRIVGNDDDGVDLRLANKCVIANNWIASNSSIGIHCNNACDEIQIVGNLVSANSSFGIQHRGAGGVIATNYVTGNSLGINLTSSTHTIVSGNVSEKTTGAASASGVQLNTTCSHINIVGNIIRECDSRGIFFTGATLPSHCTVANNICYANSQQTDNTYDHIFINGDYHNVQGNQCRQGALTNQPRHGIRVEGGTGNLVANNDVHDASQSAFISNAGTASVIRRNRGYASENSGATATVADGGTITHGLAATPTIVRATGSVAGEIVSVTVLGATTFTVAIKLHDGTAGTSQTIYWEAEV